MFLITRARYTAQHTTICPYPSICQSIKQSTHLSFTTRAPPPPRPKAPSTSIPCSVHGSQKRNMRETIARHESGPTVRRVGGARNVVVGIVGRRSAGRQTCYSPQCPVRDIGRHIIIHAVSSWLTLGWCDSPLPQRPPPPPTHSLSFPPPHKQTHHSTTKNRTYRRDAKG